MFLFLGDGVHQLTHKGSPVGGWSWSLPPVESIVLQALCLSDLMPWICFSLHCVIIRVWFRSSLNSLMAFPHSRLNQSSPAFHSRASMRLHLQKVFLVNKSLKIISLEDWTSLWRRIEGRGFSLTFLSVLHSLPKYIGDKVPDVLGWRPGMSTAWFKTFPAWRYFFFTYWIACHRFKKIYLA